MSDYSVRGSNPSPAPISTNDPATVEMNTPSVAHESVHQEIKTESSSTKSEINNQHGAAMKDDKASLGTFKQNELHQKLAADKTQIKEYPPQAGNKELDKIHVTRYKSKDQATTQFPNGVKYKQINTSETHSNDVRQVSSNSIRLQKAGSNAATEIEAPPGGKISSEKDGKTIISDARGKVVATVDKDGTLHTQSKQGNYTQSADGKIKFEQTHKGDLNSLRKSVEGIKPSDYENYGISTDGKTIRFPNGIEVIKEDPVKNDHGQPLRSSTGDDFMVRIPQDLGSKKDVWLNNPRSHEISGRAHGGEPLVFGDSHNADIKTPGGTFHFSLRDGIEFYPKE